MPENVNLEIDGILHDHSDRCRGRIFRGLHLQPRPYCDILFGFQHLRRLDRLRDVERNLLYSRREPDCSRDLCQYAHQRYYHKDNIDCNCHIQRCVPVFASPRSLHLLS